MPEFEFIVEGGRATFTPLDGEGRPERAAARTYEVHNVKATYADEPFHDFTEAIRTIPAALAPLTVEFKKLGSASWPDLYKLFTDKTWRPTKADRRKAKRRKLAQRRAARSLPHLPGRAWHVDFNLYNWSIADEARGIQTGPHPRTNYVHIPKRGTK
jgi:hypothetical protein